MSRKSRMQDLQAMKDKRMKKVAAGGAVLLAVVLAFEVPKVLSHGGSSSSPPAATTTTTPGAPTTTPTATAAPAVLPTSGTQLPNSDVAPSRSKSDLYSFSHFAGKDPFVQQVQDLTAGQPDGAGTASGAVVATAATQQSGTAATTAAVSSSSARTLATTGAVKIQVNGKIQTVRAGGSFPSSNPLFRLVSIAPGAVKIAIASGSYASGARTVSLAPGHPLTLIDTADGIRYKILLLPAS